MSHGDLVEPRYKQLANKKPKQTVHIEQGLKRLHQEANFNNDQPALNLKKLKLKDIQVLPSVFQPRTIAHDPLSSEKHISVLVTAIRNEPSHNLDPMTVWWSGKYWYIVDGHHRYDAYIKVNETGKLKIESVAVEVFRGNINDAMERSLQANSKDKLRMSAKDKLNSAWKLVCHGGYSKNDLQSKTGTSSSTIATMRKKLGEIQADYPDKRNRMKNHVAIGMTWGEALHYGRSHTPFTDDAIKELMVKLAKELGRHFGNQLSSNPQITAGALEIYSENLCNQMKQIWAAEIAIERQAIEDELNETD
jgi:hypothetical protein